MEITHAVQGRLYDTDKKYRVGPDSNLRCSVRHSSAMIQLLLDIKTKIILNFTKPV